MRARLLGQKTVPQAPAHTAGAWGRVFKGKHAAPQTPLWRRIYHFYSYNAEHFMQNYHKRSNVESTFHMIKAKFGDKLRSKSKTAQINEALCKVLCHNICCLIQSMFELNLKPKFWAEVA
jgi:transposase